MKKTKCSYCGRGMHRVFQVIAESNGLQGRKVKHQNLACIGCLEWLYTSELAEAVEELQETLQPEVLDELARLADRQLGVVVYGRQGCGKTTNAPAILAFFGAKFIIAEWAVGDPVPRGSVCLTHDRSVLIKCTPHVSFYDVLDALAESKEVKA